MDNAMDSLMVQTRVVQMVNNLVRMWALKSAVSKVAWLETTYEWIRADLMGSWKDSLIVGD